MSEGQSIANLAITVICCCDQEHRELLCG